MRVLAVELRYAHGTAPTSRPVCSLFQRSAVLTTPSPSEKALIATATDPKNNAKTTDTNKTLIEPDGLMRPSQRVPCRSQQQFLTKTVPAMKRNPPGGVSRLAGRLSLSTTAYQSTALVVASFAGCWLGPFLHRSCSFSGTTPQPGAGLGRALLVILEIVFRRTPRGP
jgi:hypothetical protein